MGARERRGTAHSLRPVGVCIDAHLSARLLRRYKRFLADVETDAGEKLTVHCPDPGSMRGCALPGAPVRCSTSDNPNRKLRHTLEMIRVGRAWVGVNTGRANHVVARALAAGAVVVGTGRSDFPNQINNSLAFPGVFRGALDARAPRITNRMKVAAAEALAGLVAEPTREYIIPWSLDKAVVPAVSQAVARAWQAEHVH